MRKIIFSIYTVSGAFIGILGVVFFIWNGSLVPALNEKDIVNLVILSIVPPVFAFYFGAYLSSSILWVIPGRAYDCSPLRTSSWTIAGFLSGIIISCVCVGIYILINPYAIDASYSSKGQLSTKSLWYIILSSSAFFAFLGARIGSGKIFEKEKAFKTRVIFKAIILILLFSPFIILFKTSDFPGRKAEASLRHDWAIKNIGDSYTKALKEISQSKTILENLGEVKQVAPLNLEGTSRKPYLFLVGSKSEPFFILEVKGEKETGIAQFSFKEEKNSSEIIGALTIENKTIQL